MFSNRTRARLRLRFGLAALAPILGTLAVFVAVVRGGGAPLRRMSPPEEAFSADHCNWYCHNHGCRHRNRLPAFLSVRLYDFGARELWRMGGRSTAGYRAANVYVFVLGWPAAMYALYLVALWQRMRR
jgi:hypothetical protein